MEFDPERIVFLHTPKSIDQFTAHYVGRIVESDFISPHLDWAAVSRDHAGIVIAPYCWERRLANHSFWYYGWDCASGCIWDLSVITKFEVSSRNGKKS